MLGLMRGDVQKIFREHYATYAQTHAVSERARRAAWYIINCRTGELGIHISACPNGHEERIHGNSCRHRSCPSCGYTDVQRWLMRVTHILPRCDYYHMVFTIAHELTILWAYNRALFVRLYFQCAWVTLRDLSQKRLGGLPGVIGTFQSWRDTLQTHLHLHFLVAGGALSPDGTWLRPKYAFLLPSQIVAKEFRLSFLAALRRAKLVRPPGMSPAQLVHLLKRAGRKRWHVEIMPPYAHGAGVAKYLAGYIKCGPINEGRLLKYDGQHLTIARKRGGSPIQLHACEFIARFLEHAPERAAHIVRAYGLFHPSQRDKLNLVRQQCDQNPAESFVNPTWQELCELAPHAEPPRCTVCHATLVTTLVIPCIHGPPTQERHAA